MNRLLLSVLAGLLTSSVAAPAFAWGGQGHRLVADVAALRLTPEVRMQVDALLATEGHQSMADVASWADELREHNPDLGKRSATWHYVNLADKQHSAEENCHYNASAHCHEPGCVVSAIELQGQRLSNRSLPDNERLEALKFVVHFVGDVHQPMHAGYAHDKGGNDFQIQHNGRGGNLHSLWDSGMLRTQALDDQAYLQRLLALPAPPLPALQPAQWAEASCRIAIRDGVYPSQRKIDPLYVSQQLPTAEAQIRLAGEQLGALLNQLLAPPAEAQPAN